MNELSKGWAIMPPAARGIIMLLMFIGMCLLMVLGTVITNLLVTNRKLKQKPKVQVITKAIVDWKVPADDEVRVTMLKCKAIRAYEMEHRGHLFLTRGTYSSFTHHPACPCGEMEEALMEKTINDFSDYLENRGVKRDFKINSGNINTRINSGNK